MASLIEMYGITPERMAEMEKVASDLIVMQIEYRRNHPDEGTIVTPELVQATHDIAKTANEELAILAFGLISTVVFNEFQISQRDAGEDQEPDGTVKII